LSETDWSHVEETVASGDPERHVATFFAPAELRRALCALYAFDQEVAHIAIAVHEPMAGHIRLAWWREQIAAIYAGAVGLAPTPRALAEVVKAHALPRDLFDAYLDARGLDLEEAPFADAGVMKAHAAAVDGGIAKLAARVLGAEARADEAATHAGVAIAAAGHLRDVALFAARRRHRLPVAWLEQGGLNSEDVFAAQGTGAALAAVFAPLKDEVRTSLRALNAARFPRAATAVLAPATLARWTARRAFDPLAPVAMPRWQLVARLAVANLAWRF
jgi:NADH dehydrogenase [ubiquinone] 1 alpha subcomplex assembly factor 6